MLHLYTRSHASTVAQKGKARAVWLLRGALFFARFDARFIRFFSPPRVERAGPPLAVASTGGGAPIRFNSQQSPLVISGIGPSMPPAAPKWNVAISGRFSTFTIELLWNASSFGLAAKSSPVIGNFSS